MKYVDELISAKRLFSLGQKPKVSETTSYSVIKRKV
jgi:hypothetical protein